MMDTQVDTPLSELVRQALRRYFDHLDGQSVSDLYRMVITEVEAPLLEETLAYTKNGSSKNNQSKAAELLGLSRGTLRKKLQEHDLL